MEAGGGVLSRGAAPPFRITHSSVGPACGNFMRVREMGCLMSVLEISEHSYHSKGALSISLPMYLK